MPRIPFWALLSAILVVLLVLVLGLNCLQLAVPFRIFGLSACGYGMTSSDLRIRVSGTLALLLFAALVFCPIAAGLGRPMRISRR